MILDQSCAERGCACHDSRVDGPGVVVHTITEEQARLALKALVESRYDVQELHDDLLPHKNYPRYARRIAAFQEQLAEHDKAIAVLKEVLNGHTST